MNSCACGSHAPGFRFAIEREGVTVEVRVDQDADIGTVVNAFEQFLLAAGFAPENVQEFLGAHPAG